MAVKPAASGGAVATLDDYVALLKLLRAGDVAGALARFGLTPESLGEVTQSWAARLSDPALALEFSRKMLD